MTTLNGHGPGAPAVTVPFPPQQDDAPRGADEFRIAAGLASWSPAALRASGLLREDEPAAVPAKAARSAVDGDKAIRLLTAVVVLAVAAIAAIVSYSHIYALGRGHGQDGTAARLLPLSVDGLIAAASLVMLHAARNDITMRKLSLSRIMLALGVGATVAANVAYGLPFGWLGAVVSAWPAVAFVGSVEMAVKFVRDARAVATAATEGTTASTADAGQADDGAADKEPDSEAGKTLDKDVDSQQDIPVAGSIDKQVDKPRASRRTRRTVTGLDKAADIIRRSPGLTNAEVAKRAGVSEKTVSRARTAIGTTP